MKKNMIINILMFHNQKKISDEEVMIFGGW